MLVKKVRGVVISFPSKELMDEILKEANVKPEEIEEINDNDNKKIILFFFIIFFFFYFLPVIY